MTYSDSVLKYNDHVMKHSQGINNYETMNNNIQGIHVADQWNEWYWSSI